MVGAPNYAPSLRSVAGLLLALALRSRYEDTAPLLQRSVTARALTGLDVWLWAVYPKAFSYNFVHSLA
ncbi:MAG TPA: hypothetical protein VK571_04995, partial [Gemmatimonadaceae bacterium]|nr:hypothetical protein [Gemmatimonadaceae bacterium]